MVTGLRSPSPKLGQARNICCAPVLKAGVQELSVADAQIYRPAMTHSDAGRTQLNTVCDLTGAYCGFLRRNSLRRWSAFAWLFRNKGSFELNQTRL
jgi:hypothetical protein